MRDQGLTQVQVRMPEKVVKEIDRWIAEGRFASRSEAIKTIVALYQEKARERPEILIPLEEVT